MEQIDPQHLDRGYRKILCNIKCLCIFFYAIALSANAFGQADIPGECAPLSDQYLQEAITGTILPNQSTAENKDCAECKSSKIIADLFQQKDDFITFLKKTDPEKLKPPKSKIYTGFPLACVQKSLEMAPRAKKGIYYSQCNENGTQIFTKTPGCSNPSPLIPKPKTTEEYAKFVHTAYLDAMSCLELDPRDMFAMINQESSFQVNIGAWIETKTENKPAGWGIAQLTTSAVTEINRSKELAELPGKPACMPLRQSLMKPMSEEPLSNESMGRLLCDRSRVPENPAKSLIYGGLLYKKYRAQARELVQRLWPRQKENWQITRELTRYMYNGGVSGISQAFETYMETRENPDESISEFKENFRIYLREHYLESSIEPGEKIPASLKRKRLELSEYTTNIERVLTSKLGKRAPQCAF